MASKPDRHGDHSSTVDTFSKEEENVEGKNATKGILVIVIVILFWMALWEFIGIIAGEWKRDLQLFFYGTVLFCVVLFILLRPDVIPHF
jgi:hypothetical protein